MPDVDWDAIIKAGKEAVNDKFSSRMASMTTLTSTKVEEILAEPGIDKENLASVLQVIKDSTKSNEAKAKAIANMSKGVHVLVSLLGKLL